MNCQWSGIATTDESGRTIYRCVNRIDGKACTRVALGNREWQSVCDLAEIKREAIANNPLECITITSGVPCKHLGGVVTSEVAASCCSNETFTVEIGNCELFGRCEIYGRGNARPCCECKRFESR